MDDKLKTRKNAVCATAPPMHLLLCARKEFFLARAVCMRECTHTMHTVSSPWKSTRDQDTPGVAINTKLIERHYLKFF